MIPAKVPGFTVIGWNRVTCQFLSHSRGALGESRLLCPPRVEGGHAPEGSPGAVAEVGAVGVGREGLSPDGSDVLIFNICVGDNLRGLKRKNPADRHNADLSPPSEI